MQTFVAVYLSLGFALGAGLFAWLLADSVRRHGLTSTIRGAARTYLRELPLYWRVPWVAWTFVIGLPLIAIWATASGDFDPVGAVAVAILWLAYLALLAWHRRAKRRADG